MSDFRFAKPKLPRRMVYCVGLAVIGFATLVALMLMTANADRRAEVDDLRATVQRAAAIAETPESGLAADAFYTGDTPQLAQAAMQTNLQTLAENFGIQIEVIRADDIQQIDSVIRLNLTLNGVAPEEELGAFLHGLATLKPMVIVEQLRLRRARTSRSDPQRRVSFQTQVYGMAQR